MTGRTGIFRGRMLIFGLVAPLAGLGVASVVGLRAQARPNPFSYTEAQAERGRASYATNCASCHGRNLDDGAFGPPLKGADFQGKWGSGMRESMDGIFTYTSSRMPPDRPGGLGDAAYADLLAYIMQENGAAAGTRELPTEAAALQAKIGRAHV